MSNFVDETIMYDPFEEEGYDDIIRICAVGRESEKELIYEALERIEILKIIDDVTLDTDIDIVLVTEVGYKKNVDSLKRIKNHTGCAIIGITSADAIKSFYDKVQADIIDSVITAEELFTPTALQLLGDAYNMKKEGRLVDYHVADIAELHRIIAIAGPSAVGKTTLAVNFALALANLKYKVLLIDADLQSDDIDIMLNIQKKNKTIYDAVISDNLSDFSVVIPSITKYKNIDIILSPVEFTDADQINPNAFEEVLKTCQQHYDYVIVDTSAHVDDISDAVYSIATDIIMVSNQNVQSSAHAKKLLFFIMECGFTGAPILLVNRTDLASIIEAEHIERIIGVNIFDAVPLDRARNNEASNEGIPILFRDPKCEYSRFIIGLSYKMSRNKPIVDLQSVLYDEEQEKGKGRGLKLGKKKEKGDGEEKTGLLAFLTQDVGGPSKNKKKKKK